MGVGQGQFTGDSRRTPNSPFLHVLLFIYTWQKDDHDYCYGETMPLCGREKVCEVPVLYYMWEGERLGRIDMYAHGFSGNIELIP